MVFKFLDQATRMQSTDQADAGAVVKNMDIDPSQYYSGMELSGGSDPAPTPTPTPEPTPAEDPKPEAPAPESPAADAPPATPDAEKLYELPDGRKVNADGLKAEYENLLPEFTRKSQELARLTRGEGGKDINKPDDTPEWKKPDYEPKSYAEVIELAKQEALREIAQGQKAEADRVAAVRTAVDAQLAEIRKTDPKVDEQALFLHANKYGFTDLRTAHANMVDMRKAIEITQQQTVKKVKEREADPISGGAPPASPAVDESYDPAHASMFGSAAEYLQRLKSGK